MTGLRTLAILLPLAALLGACQTTSGGFSARNREEFEQFRTVVRLSEQDRKRAESECIVRFDKDKEAFRRVMAIVAGVPVEQVAQVFCRRLITGVVNGTITYDDMTRS